MRNPMVMVALAICIASGCNQHATHSNRIPQLDFVWIYQRSMDANSLEKISLHRIELQEQPFWTLNDLVYYDPVNRHLAVTANAMRRVTDRQNRAGTTLTGMPFVIKSHQRRILAGAFYNHFASEAALPAIYVDTELKIGELPIGTKLHTKMWQKTLRDYDGNYVLECTTVMTNELLKILESAQKIRKPVLEERGQRSDIRSQ